jgi:hypothetical protein
LLPNTILVTPTDGLNKIRTQREQLPAGILSADGHFEFDKVEEIKSEIDRFCIKKWDGRENKNHRLCLICGALMKSGSKLNNRLVATYSIHS